MIRFFVEPPDISNGIVRLKPEDAEHIRVLRMRPAEQFIVCDGEGIDYICRLGGRSEGSIAEIIGTQPSRGEPTIRCSVYIALAKGDRLDYAVQKSVELGARDIALFPSKRCVSVPADMKNKLFRLRKISEETAKQCDRGRIPQVNALNSFEEAIGQAALAELPLFFYELEDKLHLKQALELHDNIQSASIVTGPEGGFEQSEADYAHSSGMIAVTLGPRILRCETAPAAALAAVMYHTGNL